MRNEPQTLPKVEQPLTADPAYFVMAGVFALLTTMLPIALGQPRILPALQAAMLTAFAAFPIRAGLWRRSALLSAMWLAITLLLVVTLTRIAPVYVEASLTNGFEYRSQLLEWVYGVAGYPSWHASDAATIALTAAAFLIGSLGTAGLVGYWFVFQQLNHLGYSLGLVWSATGGMGGLLLAIPWWGLLQVVGLTGLVILLSEPLLRHSWSVRRYWNDRKALILGSLILLIIGLLCSVFMPPIWQELIASRTQLN